MTDTDTDTEFIE